MTQPVRKISQEELLAKNCGVSAISNGDVAVDFSKRKKTRGEESDDKSLISNLEAIAHFLQGNIGIGVLALPSAFSNAGVIGGSLGFILIAIICVHCMKMLVRSAHKVLKTRPGKDFIDYGETAELAFQDAGGHWQKWSSSIKKLLNIFLCANTICGNSVYSLFIAQSIMPIINHYSTPKFKLLNYRYYILMVLPFTIIMCFIRKLKYLSPFSTLANLIQFVDLGIIFYYLFVDGFVFSSTFSWFGYLQKLPIFFGMALFAFEGISVVLPIENRMKNPGSMLGNTGVLNKSMSIVFILYSAMGVCGYLKYGKDVQATIIHNLPMNELGGQLIMATFSVAIFISYALQFYVIMEIIRKNLLNPKWDGWSLELLDFLCRILLNLITFGIAASFSSLDLFVSLLGATKMTTISIMAPALIDTACHWNNLGKYNWRAIKNGIIFLIGMGGCIIGSIVSVQHIIKHFVWHSYNNSSIVHNDSTIPTPIPLYY